MSIDRNLIFGLLALRERQLQADHFVEVFRILSLDKSKSVAEILGALGWINAEARRALEKRVDDEIARHGDVRKTLAWLTDAEATVLISREIVDPEIRAAFGTPGDFQSIPETMVPEDFCTFNGSTTTSAAGLATDFFSRYGAGRVQGEGGLGRVWATRDTLLNRTVALKEIRPDRLGSQQAVTGFLREAQITGQLEHPNIVPIYDLGRKPGRGEPYYTMRLVDGETFTRAIASHHALRREGKADRLSLSRLLNAFVGVCNAVGYAHSRGVIHRDLKPENVILGAFGEVILLDWGLAKVYTDADEEATGPASIELSADASVGHSVAGKATGTPAYMAPEQALGRVDQIGPATDIYGLGAILFEILTGRAPHTGRNVSEVLDRIVTGATPQARSVDPKASQALTAVCARAMSREPEGRYAQAAELAEDVQRWLADEPVSAFREPPLQRAARFARRHRAWTQAIGAGLVIVTLVSLVATRIVTSARLDETRAKNEATRRLRQAREAADTLLTGVSQGLEKVPGAQDVRTRLLQKAADFYERFSGDRSGDLNLRLESGHALNRLGEVRAILLNLDGAEDAYRAALAVFDDVSAANSDLIEPRLGRSESRIGLGQTFRVKGQNGLAEESYNAALIELRALASLAHATAEVRDRLAFAETSLGNLFSALNKDAEAEAAYRRALERYDTLVKSDPATPSYRSDRARCRGNLAVVLYDRGRALKNARKAEQAETAFLAAESAYRDAIADLKALDPEVPEYADRLAHYRINTGLVLQDLNQAAEAERELNDAIDGYERLIFRTIPDYADNLVNALVILAGLQSDAGQAELASRSDLRAIEECRRLVEANRQVIDYRRSLGSAENHLGILYDGLGKHDEALTYLNQAAQERTALVEEHPELPDLKTDLRNTLSQRCLTLRALGQVRAVVTAAQRLARLSPESPVDLFNAACHLSWAAGRSSGTSPHESRKLRDEAVYLLTQSLKRDPGKVSNLDDPDLAAVRDHPGFLSLKNPNGKAP